MADTDSASPAAPDLAASPLLVFWETTKACDLACRHCRAASRPARHPDELTTEQGKALAEALARFPRLPILVLTGGDPFKRDDLLEIAASARGAGLPCALAPSATPLATPGALARLKGVGVDRLALSLDGADAETHDAFRGFPGSFERTLRILEDARALGFSLQINTTIARRNLPQVDAIAERIAPLGVSLWSVFFLVNVGRGAAEARIAPEDYERVFERLWHHARTKPYGVKTTEAHHYRRFVLQKGGDPWTGMRMGRPPAAAPSPPRPPLPEGEGEMLIGDGVPSAEKIRATGGKDRRSSNKLPSIAGEGAGGSVQPPERFVSREGMTGLSLKNIPPSPAGGGAGGGVPARAGVHDGAGVMFVGHTGIIQPSGFLPLDCGRFPEADPVGVYRSHPTFTALRNPDLLKGKCGACEFKRVCGGSRARAFAVTGDFLAEEPDCVYVPAALRKANAPC